MNDTTTAYGSGKLRTYTAMGKAEPPENQFQCDAYVHEHTISLWVGFIALWVVFWIGFFIGRYV